MFNFTLQYNYINLREINHDRCFSLAVWPLSFSVVLYRLFLLSGRRAWAWLSRTSWVRVRNIWVRAGIPSLFSIFPHVV